MSSIPRTGILTDTETYHTDTSIEGTVNDDVTYAFDQIGIRMGDKYSGAEHRGLQQFDWASAVEALSEAASIELNSLGLTNIDHSEVESVKVKSTYFNQSRNLKAECTITWNPESPDESTGQANTRPNTVFALTKRLMPLPVSSSEDESTSSEDESTSAEESP